MSLLTTNKALQEIFLLPKFFGIHPFDNNFEFTANGVLISFIMFFFHTLFNIVALMNVGLAFRTYHSMEFFMYLFQLFLFNIMTTLSVLWFIMKGKRLKSVNKEILWISRTLRWNGIKWYWRPKKCQMVRNVIFIFFDFIFFTLSSNRQFIHVKLVLTLPFYSGLIVMYTIINMYVNFHCLIRSQIGRVIVLDNSHSLINCHEGFYTVISLMNDMFGPVMLCTLSFLYIPLLMGLYSFIRCKFENYFIVWVIMVVTPILEIIFSSHLVIKKVKHYLS